MKLNIKLREGSEDWRTNIEGEEREREGSKKDSNVGEKEVKKKMVKKEKEARREENYVEEGKSLSEERR